MAVRAAWIAVGLLWAMARQLVAAPIVIQQAPDAATEHYACGNDDTLVWRNALPSGHYELGIDEYFVNATITTTIIAQSAVTTAARITTYYGVDAGYERLLLSIPIDTTSELEIRIQCSGQRIRTPTVALGLRRLRDDAPADVQRARQLDTQVAKLPDAGSDAQIQAALGDARQAASLWREQDNLARYAASTMRAGMLAYRLDQFDAARAAGADATEAFAALDKPTQQGFALTNIAVAYERQRRFDQSLSLLAEAEQLTAAYFAGRAVNPAATTRCYVLISIREHVDAERCLKQQLDLAENIDDVVGQVGLLNNLARFYARRNDPASSVASIERALTLTQDPGQRARLTNNLGTQLNRLGLYQRAIDNYQIALSYYREQGNFNRIGRLLANIGAMYARLGFVHRAIEFREAALAANPQADPALLEPIRAALSGNYRHVGNIDQSIEISEELLNSNNPSSRFLATDNLARALQLKGETDAAIKLLRPLIKMLRRDNADQNQLGYILFTYARISNENSPEDALRYAEEALSIFKDQQNRKTEAEIHTWLGWQYWYRGQDTAALDAAQSAIDLLQRSDGRLANTDLRAADRVSAAGAYELAVTVLLHQDKPLEALALTEQSRANTLVEALSRETNLNSAKIPAALQLRRDQLRFAIAERETQRLAGEAPASLNELVIELDAIEGRIRKLDSRLDSRSVTTPLDLDGLQRALTTTDAVLVFFVGRDASAVWLVRRDRVDVRMLPAAEKLDTLARQLHEGLSKRRNVDRTATALGTLLLDWGEQLDAATQVTIVADGALHYVPFDVLSSDNDAPILADRSVSYLPSLTTLTLLRRSKMPPIEQIAVLADPVFEAGDSRLSISQPESVNGTRALTQPLGALNRLRMTAEESRAIEAAAGDRRVSVRQGLSANLAALSNPDITTADVLHIATHGFVDTDIPERNGFALSMVDSDGKLVPGFVGLRDIYALQTDASLVVLSACDTALGRSLPGEGLMGITRGFLHAGVQQVIATLWPVEDRATAELMRHFYQALLQQQLPPSDALAFAKRQLRQSRRWRHPYYWAGFTHLGDWQGPT